MGGGSSSTKKVGSVISEWRRGASGCLDGGIGGASVGFPLPSAPQQPAVNGNVEHRSSPSTAAMSYAPSQSSMARPPVVQEGDIDEAPQIIKNSLRASRDYDFRTPPNTPRVPDNFLPIPPSLRPPASSGSPPTLQGDPQVVEDTGFESTGPHGDGPGMKLDSGSVNISKDMLHAIENGISWLVDTNSDVSKLGKDETAKPDSAL